MSPVSPVACDSVLAASHGSARTSYLRHSYGSPYPFIALTHTLQSHTANWIKTSCRYKTPLQSFHARSIPWHREVGIAQQQVPREREQQESLQKACLPSNWSLRLVPLFFHSPRAPALTITWQLQEFLTLHGLCKFCSAVTCTGYPSLNLCPKNLS